MMVQNIERGTHRHERIDEGQRDPDDKGKVLLPQRLASFQFCRPPSRAPTPKLTMQSTREVRAMVSRVRTESEFSFRRKFEALAVMINRLTSQSGKENCLPWRMTACI